MRRKVFALDYRCVASEIFQCMICILQRRPPPTSFTFIVTTQWNMLMFIYSIYSPFSHLFSNYDLKQIWAPLLLVMSRLWYKYIWYTVYIPYQEAAAPTPRLNADNSLPIFPQSRVRTLRGLICQMGGHSRMPPQGGTVWTRFIMLSGVRGKKKKKKTRTKKQLGFHRQETGDHC